MNLSMKFYGNSSQWRRILKANELENPDQIFVGQVLAIPGDSNESAVAISDKPPTTYVVKPGDTLSVIAKKFYGDDKKMHYITEANSIQNANQISVGMNLTIPAILPEISPADKPSVPSFPAKHLVRSGETLDDIAKLYYGDAQFAHLIAEANPSTVHGKTVSPNTELQLPDPKAQKPPQ
jgi:nucleoid-associated protein YgaU